VTVELPESTMDVCRTMSRKEAAEHVKLATQVPEGTIRVPSRVAYDPLPPYCESPPAQVFVDLWSAASSDMPGVPVPKSSASRSWTRASQVSSCASLGSKHLADRHTVLASVRELLGHLKDVLLERLRRGMEEGHGLSLESAVMEAYR
jgi:hypothetical protein